MYSQLELQSSSRSTAPDITNHWNAQVSLSSVASRTKRYILRALMAHLGEVLWLLGLFLR